MKKPVCFFAALLSLCLIFTGCGTETDPRADNVCRLRIARSTEEDSDTEMLAVSGRSVQAFELAQKNAGAFLCDTWNYEVIDGKERFLWNTGEEYPIELDFYGQCITVTPLYFLHDPVYSTDGTDAGRQLVEEANTLNLLVPQQYRSREAEITAIYQEYMYFNNIEVSDIYAERLGLERDPRRADDFKINIIYMPQGQSYFTYKPDIASKTDHAITDCIVIVLYPENTHPVQFASAMTRGLYIPAGPGEELLAEQTVRHAFKEAGAEDSLGSFTAVRDIFKEYRQDQLLSYIIYIMAVVLAALVLFLAAVLVKRRLKKKPTALRHKNDLP